MGDVIQPLVVGAEVFMDASDPDALAREHVRLGYRAAVCPDVSIDDTDALVAIREAFARHGVLIAEVGAWRNIQTPDAAARTDNSPTWCTSSPWPTRSAPDAASTSRDRSTVRRCQGRIRET